MPITSSYIEKSYREVPLFVFLGSFPGLLHVKFDVLQQIDSEVGVRSDADSEVVDSLLVRSCELKLDLLLRDEGREVVGRGDQGVGLAVGDVNPPAKINTISSINWQPFKNPPELLLIVCVVGTVDAVRDPGLAVYRFLPPIHPLLEPEIQICYGHVMLGRMQWRGGPTSSTFRWSTPDLMFTGMLHQNVTFVCTKHKLHSSSNVQNWGS